MEKTLWILILLLWLALLGGSALGSVRRHEPLLAVGSARHGPHGDMMAISNNATPPAMARLTPTRLTPLDIARQPVVVVGATGGNELLGGVIACGLLLRYARRRRLI